MKKTELNFTYPESLIATSPQDVSRVMLVGDAKELNILSNNYERIDNSTQVITEINWDHLIGLIKAGDILVLNDTKVVPRRINDVLFLNSTDQLTWQVLFPSKKLKIGQTFELVPGLIDLKLIEKGLPQIVESNIPLTEELFEKHGELALPPYIQKMRSSFKNQIEDRTWYQTHWAEKGGSFAAPTASLHFKKHQIDYLQSKGVQILKLTLHVGLGTFLPVHAENLNHHEMHSESVYIPQLVWDKILKAKQEGRNIWALGTTVTRALESAAHGLIKVDSWDSTKLLILPGFQFKIVDRLLTNFHQPESTLLALVYAFAGQQKVTKAYNWAIENQFRLFSYGDLSVWLKEHNYS